MIARWVLYIVVSVSGAAVLAIEMLGTRLLGPFYGVSLFLWSALISVTLAALSVGYALGGRWADRGPRRSRLGWLLAGAGLWLLAVPWLQRPVLTLIEPLGLRAAVLVAACVLFALPLMLLGMVSPYAVRLKASSLDHVGRTAGNLYAISTMASVVSALATGFLLIPSVGVHRLVVLIALVLLATSLLLVERPRAAKAGAGVVSALACTGMVLLEKLPPTVASTGVLSVEHSPYAEIRVVDKPFERFLLIDGGIHTWVATDTWRPLLRYAAALDVMKVFFDAPGRLLLVGLGGGSVAKEYARDGWTVEAVEIDPVVIRVARRDFELTDSEARVFQLDGRRFLAKNRQTYDLIVMDAFGSSSIPFHLVTREVFGLVRERLTQDGILVLNVESPGWDSQLVRALGATLRTQFRYVQALPTAEPPNKLGNVLIVAANRPLEFPAERLPNPVEFLRDNYLHFLSVQMNHAWDNRFEPAPGGAVLTDDRNPVDVWAERINLAARKELHAMWKTPGTSW